MSASVDMRADSPGMDALEQAAEWFATLHDDAVTDQDKQAWQAWLGASSANAQAWTRVQQIDRQFQGLPTREAETALRAVGKSRRGFLHMVGTVLALPVAWTAWRAFAPATWRADLRTAVGEIREVELPDGGRLWLNTGSAVDIDYSNTERRLILLAGEIHIHTAADARPFSVLSPQGAAVPLGTEFSVRRDGDITRVAVIAGRVAITTQSGMSSIIEAGQAAQFDANTAGTAQAVTAGDSAWQRKVLMADDIPLSDFLDQLARYRHGVIRYDARVAQLRLVAAFPLEDTDLILDTLETTLPVTITRVTPWWVRVEGRQD